MAGQQRHVGLGGEDRLFVCQEAANKKSFLFRGVRIVDFESLREGSCLWVGRSLHLPPNKSFVIQGNTALEGKRQKGQG